MATAVRQRLPQGPGAGAETPAPAPPVRRPFAVAFDSPLGSARVTVEAADAAEAKAVVLGWCERGIRVEE